MVGNKIINVGLVISSLAILTSVAGLNIGIGLILIGLIIKKIRVKEFKFKGTKLDLAIFIYILVNLLSVIFSVYPLASFKDFTRIVQHIFTYYIIFNSIDSLDSLESIKKIIGFMMASLFIASAYSIYQHYVLEVRRASAFIPTLTYESVLLLVLPMVIVSLFIDLSKGKKSLVYTVIIMGSLSLVFSNTRGAWLGMIGSIGFLSIFKKRLSIFALVIVIFSFFIYPEFYQRALTIVDSSNNSNSQRMFMWRSAFDMFKDYPLFGAGLGMFSELYVDEYILPGAEVKSWRYAHSIVMTKLSEIGSIGLLSFLLLVFCIFKNGLSVVITHSSYWSNISLGLMAGILGFLIHGLTFYNIGLSHSAKSFWIIVAILMVIEKNTKQFYRREEGSSCIEN